MRDRNGNASVTRERPGGGHPHLPERHFAAPARSRRIARRQAAALARLHAAGADFALSRPNSLSVAGWQELAAHTIPRAEAVQNGLGGLIAGALAELETQWPQDLPAGIIHADLFPDNVLFMGDTVSGVIDFYFACHDMLAYDLAVTLNSWCFETDGAYNVTKGRAMIAAYRAGRAQGNNEMSDAEIAAMPLLMRGAALRFLLTRLYDWLNPDPNALVRPKDPREYSRKLRFHASVKQASGIWLLSVDEFLPMAPVRGNPGPGGWGAILRMGAHEKELSGGEAGHHQQPHGIDGGDRGLERAEKAVRRDALYRQPLCDGRRHDLAERLESEGWKTADKKPVKNEDLWRALDDAMARHQITWRWVQGP